MVGGGGGGRPEFAQAGGKEPAKIDAALKRAEELIREANDCPAVELFVDTQQIVAQLFGNGVSDDAAIIA